MTLSSPPPPPIEERTRVARTMARTSDPNSGLRFGRALLGATLTLVATLMIDGDYPHIALGLAVTGALLVGYSYQPDAFRSYMEGFADGLVEGGRLGAAARDAERMAERRGRLQRDDEERAARPPREDQQPDAGGRHLQSDPDAGRFLGGHRPPRPAVTEDGRPIPTSGPRPSFLPAIERTTALGLRSAGQGSTDRAPDGPAAPRRKRDSRAKENE